MSVFDVAIDAVDLAYQSMAKEIEEACAFALAPYMTKEEADSWPYVGRKMSDVAQDAISGVSAALDEFVATSDGDLVNGGMISSTVDRSGRRIKWIKSIRFDVIVGHVSDDPLDVKHDDVSLRMLIARDEKLRTGGYDLVGASPVPPFTPAQRAAISAHWSAELRTKVEAKRKADAERERTQVVVDADPEDFSW